MRESSLVRLFCAIFSFWALTMVSPAQTFNSLASFDGTDGAGPEFVSLVQGLDGNLYGKAVSGGNSSCESGCGTVFKITLGGTLTAIYTFCEQAKCADGELPFGGMALATDGDFYGTTSRGGSYNLGTVFQVNPDGALTTLHSFCAQTGCPDGARPSEATLVLATDGSFYGTTGGGGADNDGTLFKITPTGTLSTLHTFDGTDGGNPAGLVLAGNGDLYGITGYGGTINACNGGCGTVFKITPAGTLTTLHSFDNTDGFGPIGGFVQASNGDFYGTTILGGSNGDGTVFKIAPNGTFTSLHSFDGTAAKTLMGG
jgi:uncharacterized repeat protein (TIGR03803 family)